MKGQEYAPFLSKIVKVKKHTEIEYTFSMEYFGDVKPGQFFEVSIPKYGEAPISVSGIGPDYVDLTIRRVGRVTGWGLRRTLGWTPQKNCPGFTSPKYSMNRESPVHARTLWKWF